MGLFDRFKKKDPEESTSGKDASPPDEKKEEKDKETAAPVKKLEPPQAEKKSESEEKKDSPKADSEKKDGEPAKKDEKAKDAPKFSIPDDGPSTPAKKLATAEDPTKAKPKKLAGMDDKASGKKLAVQSKSGDGNPLLKSSSKAGASEPGSKAPAAALKKPTSLEELCYGIAYFVLPKFVSEDFPKLKERWSKDPGSVGHFLYLVVCKMKKANPKEDVPGKFKTHKGELVKDTEYLILEYPEPTPLTMDDKEMEAAVKEGKKITLAPFFSAILKTRDGDPVCYVIGQSTKDKSVLRKVSTRTNEKVGPGPDKVDLESFLSSLRDLQKEKKKD